MAAPLLHARLLPDRPGALNRTQVWWDRVLHDPKEERNGASGYRFALHRSSAGDVDGYAQYRVKPAWEPDGPADELRITELDAANGPARAACGGTCSIWTWSAPSPSSTPRSTSRCAIWWPISGPSAPSCPTRRTPGSSTCRVRWRPGGTPPTWTWWSEIRDGLLPREQRPVPGRSHRRGEPSRSAAVRRKPDLSLDIRELGAGYLGGVSLRTLHGAGLVEERYQRLGGGDDHGLRVGPAAFLPGPLLMSRRR